MGSRMAKVKFRIGTAGWSIPTPHKEIFETEGSHLERYAKTFNAVEINSSFYRDHQSSTYKRWSESVPKDFSFSVKLNKIFTHEQKLNVDEAQLVTTIEGIHGLGSKWGALLVQLPPKLSFDKAVASAFFKTLRKHYKGSVALEPRNISWSASGAVLEKFKISKVVADPERCPFPAHEKISPLPYARLHGSPQLYKSSYSPESLQTQAKQMISDAKRVSEVWCIFDNTGHYHASLNAIDLKKMTTDRASSK